MDRALTVVWSQQAPHELVGRLLGSDLEDRRGEDVEALGWIFPERLVCEGPSAVW